MNVLKEYLSFILNELNYVTSGVPQDIIDELKLRGVDIYRLGPSFGWNPKVDGLSDYQIEAITASLLGKLDKDKYVSPKDFLANASKEDIAIANVLGGKDNIEALRKAKELNISYLIDDIKKLRRRGRLSEYWDQHIEKYIDSGEELPWNNSEEADFNKNPLNPYDANNSLNKVKPSVPGTQTQRAGIKRGSGTAGGQRNPGGRRQATSSKGN
jgi:hypothetical protein